MNVETNTARIAGLALALGLGAAVAAGGIPSAAADGGTNTEHRDAPDTHRDAADGPRQRDTSRTHRQPLAAIRDIARSVAEQGRTAISHTPLPADRQTRSENVSTTIDSTSETNRPDTLPLGTRLPRQRDVPAAAERPDRPRPQHSLPDLADLSTPRKTSAAPVSIPRISIAQFTGAPERPEQRVPTLAAHIEDTATAFTAKLVGAVTFAAPSAPETATPGVEQRGTLTTTTTPSAPGGVIQRMLGVLGSLMSGDSANPGHTGGTENPIALALVGWVRRELFNAAPQASTPVTMTGNTLTLDATDPDGDPLTYTVTQPAVGSVEQTSPGVFTYTPEAGHTEATSFTVTVSDADSGFHLHGLAGLFAPDGGHAKTVVVNVPAQDVEQHGPEITPVPMDLPVGYSSSGNSFVGSNGTAAQYASHTDTATNQTIYALAVRDSTGITKVVDLEGKPVEGQDPLITDSAVVQNIQRADGTYALVVVPTASPAPAPQSFARLAPAALTTFDAPPESATYNLNGKPVGDAVAGADGIIYQSVNPTPSTNDGIACSNCQVAVVDTSKIADQGYSPTAVDIPGLFSPGFSTAGGIKQSGLSTDSSGRLYVVQWSPTSNIWVIDPDNVDTAAANDGATVIPLGGTTGGGLKVAFGPDGKGYIGTSTASGGQVEIIDPSSRTVEKTVAMPAAPSAAQAINAGTVFANGTVYQQQVLLLPTGVSSAPYSYQSRMVTFPVGGPTAGVDPQVIAFPGDSNFGYGTPVAGADGTVYQGMVDGVNGTTLRTGIIRPGETTPIVVALGPSSTATYNSPVVTGSGQAYQVTSTKNTDDSGVTTVFRLSDADADQTSHPLQPVVTIDEHSVPAAGVAAPDGTLYFATQKDGTVTVWSLAKDSNQAQQTVFTGQGTPSAFQVGSDGHVYMTTTSADGTQSWVYAIDAADPTVTV